MLIVGEKSDNRTLNYTNYFEIKWNLKRKRYAIKHIASEYYLEYNGEDGNLYTKKRNEEEIKQYFQLNILERQKTYIASEITSLFDQNKIKINGIEVNKFLLL